MRASPGALLVLVLAAFFAAHLHVLPAAPNGFHTWRESDTATVADNFATEDMRPHLPRVNVRGTDTGIVGMELPVYNYAAALLYRTFGFSHVWPRLLTLLGACGGLLAMAALFRRLFPDGPRTAPLLGAYLAACSPLYFFYAAKIQPDIWGLALATGGFVAFLRWRETGAWRDAALCAAALALAGGIKPTFLFVGLPMLALLVRERRVTSAPALALAAAILGPVLAWFVHARRLTAVYGSEYFYIGGSPLEELQGLLSPQFYQNVLLTWPFELALGLPTAVFFGAAVWRWRALPQAGRRTLGLWAAGCFVVFVAMAQHCATPHDYYYLPIVPALAGLAGQGAAAWLGSPRRGLRTAAILLLAVAPVAGYLRVNQRTDLAGAPDVAALRDAVRAGVEPGALALAVDKVPGYLLYVTGLKGWRVGLDAGPEELARHAELGARYVVIAEKHTKDLSAELRAALPPPVAARDGVSVHPIAPPR